MAGGTIINRKKREPASVSVCELHTSALLSAGRRQPQRCRHQQQLLLEGCGPLQQQLVLQGTAPPPGRAAALPAAGCDAACCAGLLLASLQTPGACRHITQAAMRSSCIAALHMRGTSDQCHMHVIRCITAPCCKHLVHACISPAQGHLPSKGSSASEHAIQALTSAQASGPHHSALRASSPDPACCDPAWHTLAPSLLPLRHHLLLLLQGG
jgi:hypothetical protein